MSLFCSISGTQPLHPVVSSKSGHVYEKDLILKALANNDGKDPITAEQLAEEDLIEVKTAPGQPTAPPRAPTFTSVPSLLHTLQQEWDSTMLECLELRRESSELRQELSHALYKEDAAMRVLARVTRERDEAREALASVQATLGPGYSAPAPAAAAARGAEDAQMDVEESSASEGLPADAKQRVEHTAATLSAGRKKRKPSPEAATIDEVKAFAQGTTIPSVHTTKPPGVSALTLAKNGELFVSGGMDKNVIVFDRSTSKPVATLKGHTKKVTAVLASTEQSDDLPSFLVSASLDKSVRVWTPNGKKTAYDCSTNLSLGAEVNALALHPSNSLAAAALADGSWAVIDLATGDKAAVVLTGALPAGAAEGTANSAVAFHPDGGMFGVGSSDAKIRVFEISSGKCAAEFDGHAGAGPVTSLSFSENGYTLASSAQGSQQVKIWDLRKLSNSANIDLDEGVTASVVAFDPSAQFLAVVGSDARVYAYKSWELLAKSDDNAAELTGAAWGPNAHELLVAGLDRTVRVLSKPAAE